MSTTAADRRPIRVLSWIILAACVCALLGGLKFRTPVGFALGYVVGLNVLTWLAFGVDKWLAGQEGRRIPEKELWGLAAWGGGPGAIAGMLHFKHKTRKRAFIGPLAAIFALQVLIVTAFMFMVRLR
ncbi:MAG: DUF1294 domain-containing protein [Verrucomicrobiae bacterium]|nr:DUF1294 domain-containing protein [Verrucomicrobiae bacterium]